ncbi:MAG TPA: lysophospholipid acyltransferase family protein [Cyclobacteriaceae bacterium]|nr:lysophospholipid acyltransferase family protein [Cyclobacteriaceae bacterium]
MFIIKLISKLPLSWLYGIADFASFILCYLVPYRKKLVRRNLQRAFPYKDQKYLKAVEKKFYKNLCDYGVETIKAYSISKEELSKRVTFILPQDETFGKQAIIGLASHQFNWEWLMLAGCIQLGMPMEFVYQPLKQKSTDRFMKRLRSRFGGRPVKRNKVASEAIRRKNEVRIIALVADQFPGKANDKRYWTQFLGRETAFYQGIDQLVRLTQYPVYHFGIRKVKRGYYECHINKIASPPYSPSQSVLDAYIKATERMIKQEPEGWLWSHNRWKKSRQKADA